jgi:molecular chaperone GrpE (heat shock protein)
MGDRDLEKLAEKVVQRIRGDIEQLAKLVIQKTLQEILEELDRLNIILDQLQETISKEKTSTENIPRLNEVV